MALEKPKEYLVNWHVEHDGKAYEKGDGLKLAAEAAAPLLTAGAISDPSEQLGDPAVEPEA